MYKQAGLSKNLQRNMRLTSQKTVLFFRRSCQYGEARKIFYQGMKILAQPCKRQLMEATTVVPDLTLQLRN